MPLSTRLARSVGHGRPAYRVGDVLKLKSGGCAMTVTWSGPVLFAPGNWLICQWFGETGELMQDMFPEETLERQRAPTRS
ncbi:MAG TPA: YodC family protein [Paraburkholderia sp.]